MDLISVYSDGEVQVPINDNAFVLLPATSNWSVNWNKPNVNTPFFCQIDGKGIFLELDKDGHYSLPAKFQSRIKGSTGFIRLYKNIECTEPLKPSIVRLPKLIGEELFVKIFSKLHSLAFDRNSAVKRAISIASSNQGLVSTWVERSQYLLLLLDEIEKSFFDFEESQSLGMKFQYGEVKSNYLIRQGLMAFSMSKDDEKRYVYGPRRVCDFGEGMRFLKNNLYALRNLYLEIREALSQIQTGKKDLVSSLAIDEFSVSRSRLDSKVDIGSLLQNIESRWNSLSQKLEVFCNENASFDQEFDDNDFLSDLRNRIAKFTIRDFELEKSLASELPEWLFLGAPILGPTSTIEVGVLDEDKIYERWTACQIIESLLRRDFKVERDSPSLKLFFSKDVLRQSGDIPWLHLKNTLGDRISISAEPAIYRDIKGNSHVGWFDGAKKRSGSDLYDYITPDLLIKFQSHRSDEERLLIFDAKYKPFKRKKDFKKKDIEQAKKYKDWVGAYCAVLILPEVPNLIVQTDGVFEIALSPLSNEEALHSLTVRIVLGYLGGDSFTCQNCGGGTLRGEFSTWTVRCNRCDILWRVRNCPDGHENLYFATDSLKKFGLPETYRNGINGIDSCLLCGQAFSPDLRYEEIYGQKMKKVPF